MTIQHFLNPPIINKYLCWNNSLLLMFLYFPPILLRCILIGSILRKSKWNFTPFQKPHCRIHRRVVVVWCKRCAKVTAWVTSRNRIHIAPRRKLTNWLDPSGCCAPRAPGPLPVVATWKCISPRWRYLGHHTIIHHRRISTFLEVFIEVKITDSGCLCSVLAIFDLRTTSVQDIQVQNQDWVERPRWAIPLGHVWNLKHGR